MFTAIDKNGFWVNRSAPTPSLEKAAYLRDFESKIDLLYLDPWVGDADDVFPGTGRAEAYREANMAAKDKLIGQSLILIDDTDHIEPW